MSRIKIIDRNVRFMKRSFSLAISIIILGISLSAQTAEECRRRRSQVLETMKPNSVLVLRSRGSFGRFHTEPQDGNFYYLTGIDEPEAYLVLRKRRGIRQVSSAGQNDPEQGRVILFIATRDERRAAWDALPLGLDGARKKGFANVRPSTDFAEYFDNLLLEEIDILYMDIDKSRQVTAPFTADEQIMKRAREKGAAFELISASEILTPLGRTRSASEIALLRKAIDITAEAQIAAMQALAPGMYEHQLQAVIEYVYTLNGAQRPAFPCIIGSGRNSCILHWMLNTRKMNAGEVVVVDIGANYNHYSADITRTLPVSGKFSKRQREVYEIVLAVNEAAIAMVAPGVQFREISKMAADMIGEGLVGLGLIENKKEYRRYYFHGLGHSIGLRVGGSSGLGRMEPGMVITIEPGIYIREEGLGVRIEDDVLVTETGHEVLSRGAPKTVAEIEKLMKMKGLDYTNHLLKK